MKQFGKILKFELKNYMTNKVFVGVTVFLMVVIVAVMFFPRVMEAVSGGDDAADQPTSDRPVMLLTPADQDGIAGFQAAFPDYAVKGVDTEDEARDQVQSGAAKCAFSVRDDGTFTYYVDDLTMYDTNMDTAQGLVTAAMQMKAMLEGGLSAEAAASVLSAQARGDVVSLGQDQFHSFFYTYIMIFALYMVILLYGQMVATNVATEKSSRAMELLVTSADPVSMMFGKVLSSCLAGLIQLVCVFGSALLCFSLNRSYWGDNPIVSSIFDMPTALFFYMLAFFVLGFLIYAFLFGAVGSTASKLEDINTSVMPITLLFIAGFIVVVMALSTGETETALMKACSFIPFTSPMAMFTRIAMSQVPAIEIALSMVILVASVIAIGFISARIYRVGVLLYGTPPKPAAIIKAVLRAR